MHWARCALLVVASKRVCKHKVAGREMSDCPKQTCRLLAAVYHDSYRSKGLQRHPTCTDKRAAPGGYNSRSDSKRHGRSFQKLVWILAQSSLCLLPVMSSFSFLAGVNQDKNVAHTDSHGPSNAELDAIQLPDYGLLDNRPTDYSAAINPAGLQTPREAKTTAPTTQVPQTPNQLEASLPSTPRQHLGSASVVPSLAYPYMNRWRVLTACLEYFGNGINDSAPGALIPYFESWFGIGYAVVSLIFVSTAIGFILAAFFADAICVRFGRARSLMLSEATLVAAYVMLATTPPFGVVIAAYLIIGFGSALNLAYNNVFCAGLAQPTIILGAAHGSYGIGGILGPIMATALVSSGVVWSRFFLIPIGVRLCCLALAGWSFWTYESESTTTFASSLERLASKQQAEELGQPSKLQLLRQCLSNRTVLIGALFIFAYQGAEVSDSGWFISYLISYRGGDPSKVGYVTSGFWAGITVGRFVLTHLAHRVGEKPFVFALGILSLLFQILSWVIPSIIGDAGMSEPRLLVSLD